MASLSVKFQSSTCTWMSFNHDWNIKFAIAEYPPLHLLILSLCSLQNSCAAIFIWYPGGDIVGFASYMLTLSCWGSKMLSSPNFVWGFGGVYVKPTFWPVSNCTWQRWCESYVDSSANSSSKKALTTTGMFCNSQDKCLIPASHLAFTVLGSMLNASLCISSSHNGGGWVWGIWETFLCCS